MKPEVVTITPEIALDILTSNTCNRPVRPAMVMKYAGAMSRDEWQPNGEAIKIADDGTLLDGQHRLLASIESESSFVTLMVTGLPREAQQTMDSGLKRGMSDRLAFLGEQNSHALGTVLRKLTEYEFHKTIGMQSSGRSSTITDQMLLMTLEQHPKIREYAGQKHGLGAISHTSMAVFEYIVRHGSYAERVDTFLAQVRTGEMLSRTSPVLLLRNQVVRTTGVKLGRGKPEALLIKTWNSWIAGRETQALAWRADENFPVIAGS